jgi:hypothetical protein
MTRIGTYVMYQNAEGLYRIEFSAHGYEKQSPWLKSKKLALNWAADFWAT